MFGGHNDLCSRLSDLVQSAILGCVPATSFDYRIYLILRDGLAIPERVEVFRAIREMYTANDTYRRIRKHLPTPTSSYVAYALDVAGQFAMVSRDTAG